MGDPYLADGVDFGDVLLATGKAVASSRSATDGVPAPSLEAVWTPQSLQAPVQGGQPLHLDARADLRFRGRMAVCVWEYGCGCNE